MFMNPYGWSTDFMHKYTLYILCLYIYIFLVYVCIYRFLTIFGDMMCEYYCLVSKVPSR